MSSWSRARANLVAVASLAIGFLALPSPMSKAQTPDSPQAHLAQGLALLRGGNYQQARSEFEAAVKLNPQQADGYIFLGVAENQLGNLSAAVSALREALRLDPNSEAAHYNLALSLLRQEKIDEAIEQLQQVVRINPRNPTARYNLGLLLEGKGRFKESVEHLEAARAGRPNDPAVLVHLVNATFKAGDGPRALQLARESMQVDSSGGLAAGLGALLMENGYYQEAIPPLERARTASPDSLELATTLARAYLGANRPAQAIELLSPLREREPSWQVRYLLGLAYISSDQPEAAAASLLEATRLKPDEAAAHYRLGTLLLKSTERAGQKAGVDEIEKAINLAPHELEYYINLGRWLLDHYELEPAISLLKRAIDSVPPSVELCLMLGLAEAELHGSAAARPFIEKAIELNPRVGPAYNLLGNLYLRVGDYENAVKYYKQAVELSPQNDLYFYDVALSLERLNKTAEAIPYAEKSTELKPDRSFNHYMLGKLYAKVGRQPEAIRELETSVRLDSQVEYPYYLLARTYMQIGDRARAQAWSRKLQELKDEKNRAVGLSPPASESPRVLEPVKPWETSTPATQRPGTSPP